MADIVTGVTIGTLNSASYPVRSRLVIQVGLTAG